jgi:hypothetical protein
MYSVVYDPVTIRRCGMNLSKGIMWGFAKLGYVLFQMELNFDLLNHCTHSVFPDYAVLVSTARHSSQCCSMLNQPRG